MNWTDGFEVMSWTLFALESVVALGLITTGVVLAAALCLSSRSDSKFKMIRLNVIGNMLSQFIMLVAVAGFMVIALEPFALPGPIGGATRSLSLRLLSLYVVNEANVRWNFNAASVDVVATRRKLMFIGMAAQLVFLSAVVFIVLSMQLSDCIFRCSTALQLVIVLVPGTLLLFFNGTTVALIMKKSRSPVAVLFSLVFWLSSLGGVVIGSLDAMLDLDGRNTVLLQSPLDSKHELYYLLAAVLFAVYALSATVLLMLSPVWGSVVDLLRARGYQHLSSWTIDRHYSDHTSSQPRVEQALSWMF